MRKVTIIICAITILSNILSGCSHNNTTNVCAVCGNDATHTFSGPTEYIIEAGINLSDCKKITDSIYSAYLCDSCDKVPVARDPADN